MKIWLQNLMWYPKQLIPFTYRTWYVDGDGKKHYTVWQMWFGRCFNVDDVVVGA